MGNLYSVDSIRPDPNQPRKNKPVEYLRDELAVSIAHTGLDNDIHIRPDPDAPGEFLVVNGECRWTAVSLYLPGVLQEMARNGEEPCMNGWHRDENGAISISAKLKEYSGENVAADVFLDQIRDNEVRKNLGPVETLRAFETAVNEHGIPLWKMAKALGKSVATFEADLPILGLPSGILRDFDNGILAKAVARKLAELPLDQAIKAYDWAKKGKDANGSIAKIEAYLRARKGESNASLFDNWQQEDPKWRRKAKKAFGSLQRAVNVFDQSPYANGDFRKVVLAKISEVDELEMTAKAMIRQAEHILTEVRTVKAEAGKKAAA